MPKRPFNSHRLGNPEQGLVIGEQQDCQPADRHYRQLEQKYHHSPQYAAMVQQYMVSSWLDSDCNYVYMATLYHQNELLHAGEIIPPCAPHPISAPHLSSPCVEKRRRGGLQHGDFQVGKMALEPEIRRDISIRQYTNTKIDWERCRQRRRGVPVYLLSQRWIVHSYQQQATRSGCID